VTGIFFSTVCALMTGQYFFFLWPRNYFSVFGKFQGTELSYSLSTPCFVTTAPSGETCKYATVPSTKNNLER